MRTWSYFNYNAYRVTAQNCPAVCVVQLSVLGFSDVAGARSAFDYLKADTRKNIPAGQVRTVPLAEAWDEHDDVIIGPFSDGATWAAFMGRVGNVLVFHASGTADDARFTEGLLQVLGRSIDMIRRALR